MPNFVKNTTIINPLELLAPHSCRGCGALGSILCERCKNNILKHRVNLCPKCKNKNTAGKCQNCHDSIPTFVVSERTDLVGELIHNYKYHSVRATAKPLAELLDAIIPNYKGAVAIVPLPTISKHIRERGFDHTLLIAKHLAKLRGPNYHVSKLLVRNKNFVQVGSDRQTRQSQAKTAYEVNTKKPLNPKVTYLLLDDVWTTGASIQAATEKISAAGAIKINRLILALSRIN